MREAFVSIAVGTITEDRQVGDTLRFSFDDHGPTLIRRGKRNWVVLRLHIPVHLTLPGNRSLRSIERDDGGVAIASRRSRKSRRREAQRRGEAFSFPFTPNS